MPTIGIDFSAVQTTTYDFPMPGGVTYSLSDDIPFTVLSRDIGIKAQLGEIQQRAQAGELDAATAQKVMDDWSEQVVHVALDLFHCTPAYAALTYDELKAAVDIPLLVAIIDFFSSRVGQRYVPLQSATTATNPTPVATPASA